jgi:hypothetical protein
MERQAESITLKISFRYADGSPFFGTIDIECDHLTLSDRRKVPGVDGSRTIAIAGLKRAPQ